MRKELWFGLPFMIAIVVGTFWIMPAPSDMTNEHLGLLMLSLVVVTIMLGFPTAFTLMGMGMAFAWMAFDYNIDHTLTLMVQRAYGVMTNDVLISIPLFVFMGYLVERANLIERLFTSLHLATAWIPGSLTVATLVTCAVFATATGIVGAVVTLMGLLAFPAMLKAGYDIRFSAGAITAGGCLGILIPPSVMLIVYGATAGVSVVQLYAGAFFPGLMLAGLYIVYTVTMAWLRPKLAPPLPLHEREIAFSPAVAGIAQCHPRSAPLGLLRAMTRSGPAALPAQVALREFLLMVVPLLTLALVLGLVYRGLTAPAPIAAPTGLLELGSAGADESMVGGVQEPPGSGDLATPPSEEGGLAEPPGSAPAGELAPPAESQPLIAGATDLQSPAAVSAPPAFWLALAACAIALAGFYALLSPRRYEIYRMLMSSFVPLSLLILCVLGTIVFGFATPTEAAAVGAIGGALLALAYRRLTFSVVKESVFLTAKTTAMVCWLFVGSSIFSAAFALLGGQAIIERWVLSLDMTPVQFLLLSQVVIFLLGWPLEWTEIIVIFMPIFIPLLTHFDIDPLFFGLLVALNLQTAFLSPPVAMAAFYLKGVAPKHVTLNQIFAGMMPFMMIQVLAMALLYLFPGIGLWLPHTLYR
jgi:TRAP-type mannitol/chloroaromatic compound transport system permease large subunit